MQRNWINSWRRSVGIGIGLCVVATAWGAWGQQRPAPVKRARPPKFSQSIQDAFFPDAREKLAGPRPAAAPIGKAATPAAPAVPDPTPEAAGATGWSRSIAADVIENEIKSQLLQLNDSLQNPTKFKGGDYQKAREYLSVLAAMFAVDAEYDAQIRWHRDAGGLRDVLARAAANCKVATDASYREAKKRADDLQTLVRGGSIDTSPGKPDAAWGNVDRSQLMKRLDKSQKQALAPWTSNAGEFSKHADRLAQEAQMVAALAEVITREGYESADDETYREYAKAMQTQALAVRDAVAQQNYDQARAAAAQVSKACSDCHDGYRN